MIVTKRAELTAPLSIYMGIKRWGYLALPFSKQKDFSFLPRETVLLADLWSLSHSPLQQPGALSQGALFWRAIAVIFIKTAMLDTNDNYFISDKLRFSQPSLRAALHLCSTPLWVTDLRTQPPRVPRHTKGSKYHTLIDSESYFPPQAAWELHSVSD